MDNINSSDCCNDYKIHNLDNDLLSSGLNDENVLNSDDVNVSVFGQGWISPISIFPIINESLQSEDLRGLQNLIDKAPIFLDLHNDFYNYMGKKNQVITINKNLILDGHGHTIDFGYYEDCYFKSTEGDITFKNLIIKNAYNDKDDFGGAMYLKNGRYIFENCSFIHCWAQKSGGAIYANTKYDVIVRNCLFEDNKIRKKSYDFFGTNKAFVDRDGGAIWVKKNIFIESSVFKDNFANVCGGAVYAGGNIYVDWNSTGLSSFFEGNSCRRTGGVLYSKDSVFVRNCYFDNNKAMYGGCVIWAKESIKSIDCIYGCNYNDNAINKNVLKCDKSNKNIVRIDHKFSVNETDFDDLNNVCL